MYNCTWIAYGLFERFSILPRHYRTVEGDLRMTVSLIKDAAMMESGNTMTNCPEQRENNTLIYFGGCTEIYPFIHPFLVGQCPRL